jgi:hypothetical protein
MDPGPTTPRWRTEEYAAWLHAWVESVVGPVRMTRRKLRPWATVWRADAADGVYWAKQNCPSQAFEGELTRLLAGLVPDRVLDPVAVRDDDGVFLLPDGGPVLRDVDGGPDDLGAWGRVVAEWATLQRALVPHTGEISDVGVVTLAPGAVVAQALARADDLHTLDPADPRHLDELDWRRVRAAEPALVESAGAVVDLGLPLALNHNDLHDGNSFVAGEAPLRFFDLADAVLTDPMAVLLVPLGQLPDDSRARGAVVRAWVQVWRETTDESALWRVLPHALRLAAFARHEAWWRVMGAMTEDELIEWGRAAPYWLARLAVPPPDLLVLARAE